MHPPVHVRIKGVRLRRWGAWLLFVLGGSASPVAHAGAGVWTSGGPYSYRGQIYALAVNPAVPTTLYAGTLATGVFRSSDSGGTWVAVNTGLASLNVFTLAINPLNPTTLYAGTDAGVFKSTNSGGAWIAVNTGLTNPWVSSLAIDPSTPATLYAAGRSGVFKTTDSGGMWIAVNSGITNLGIYALAVDPVTPSTLYAGIGGNGPGTGAGIYKSSDAGATWAAANTGLTDLDVRSLAINPVTPTTLYAGTNGGVFKSTSSGATWSASNSGLTDHSVLALAINPEAPTTLYAGMEADGHGGVFKSTDSGATWTAANQRLQNAYINALAINPATPSVLYAGSFYGGVFRSTNSGDMWALANSGIGPSRTNVAALAIDPTTPTTLYAGTNSGFGDFNSFFRSTDSGSTWVAAGRELAELRVVALVVDPLTPAILYAGTGGDLAVHGFGGGSGIFKSTDSGGTWTAINAGLTDPNLNALAIDPTTPSTLYAGTHGGGVFKSVDSGAAWTAVIVGLTNPYVGALAIDPKTPSTLYAGTAGGVFKSTNSGGTWTAINVGLTSPFVDALTINPATPSTIYAGTYGGGVFRSTDSGATWTAASKGLSDPTVLSLAINPAAPSTLYAGTLYGGIFRSTNSGGTWAAINVGLPTFAVKALALDPRASSTLYAGGGSVWQSTPAGGVPSALIPTSAHSTGLGGAFYTTDVVVSNTGGSNASFTLKFLGNNQDGSGGPERTFNLDPGRSTTFIDVLGTVFNETSGFGAIRVTSSTSPLGVGSVTSTPGFGGTFGQAASAVSSQDLIPAGSARSILYIREGDGFRSNLVLASSASDSTNVDVALVSPAGSILATKTYPVPPNGMTQINRVVRDLGVSGSVTGARLVLSSINPRAAFTALASVIDETTNDPIAVPAQPDSAVGLAPFTWLLPSTAHSSGLGGAFYTTNVAVANVGVAPASFTMKFLGNNRDGSGGPEKTFNLEVGKSVTYFDVLGSVFNQTSNFGALRITSSSSFLNVVSVTSTPGFGGTFGQSSPAVSSSDLIPAGSSRSILSIHEGDGFRSNLILASNAGVSTTIDVALVSPAGVTLATKSYTVPPLGMTQVNRVARDMGVLSPITGARLVLSSTTPDASFTAFASVIDEVTNDPSAVQPQ